MNWRHKAFILRQLSQWPGGKTVYLNLQRLLGTTRPQPQRDFRRAIELIEMIREVGQDLPQTSCFEIGTGWHPFTPLAFYLAGAEQIETYDINPWLSLSSCRQAVLAAEQQLEWFAKSADLCSEQVQKRYLEINHSANNLNDLLTSMNCTYSFPGDATKTQFSDHTFDYVISSNVLEHIPPKILKDIVAESLRILKPGGLAVHRFNPGDHFANDDPSLNTGHFLKFSPGEWEKYGSGLAYHNRLRCSQYSKLFRECGYLSLLEQTRVDEQVLEHISSGNQFLDEHFQQFTPEDLAADYMWTVGMKGGSSIPGAICENGTNVTSQDRISTE